MSVCYSCLCLLLVIYKVNIHEAFSDIMKIHRRTALTVGRFSASVMFPMISTVEMSSAIVLVTSAATTIGRFARFMMFSVTSNFRTRPAIMSVTSTATSAILVVIIIAILRTLMMFSMTSRTTTCNGEVSGIPS